MGTLHRFMLALSRLMAFLGGVVLTAVVVLVCLSILGREFNAFLNGAVAQGWAPGLANALLGLGIGPVTGDFELVEAGVAFAIFAFLPLCQITGAHAAVDIFTQRLPAGANRWLRAVIEVAFAAVLVLIAVQLYDGMLTKLRSGQTSFLLQFPIWWGYAAGLVGAVVAALVGIYMAGARCAEGLTGRMILPPDEEADH